MTELTLVSAHRRSLKPLIKSALANEARLLDLSLRRTEQRIQAFEEKYHLPTDTFLARFENDELDETLDFAEWVGEYRLLKRMREKADILRGIKFAN
ncbi:MAG TPA: hypothetical protein G4N96_03190 [Chloroflexi bacterium]|nr:hypothetical protein [Chloroflexota bacterium]